MRPNERYLIEEEDDNGGNVLTPVVIEQVHHKGLKALVKFPSGGTIWVPTRHLIELKE